MDVNILLKTPKELRMVPTSKMDDVADKISEVLENKIHKSCIRIVSSTTFGDSDLPKAAFKYVAKKTVRDAVKTYCAHEKWKDDVPIIPYISTALNRLVKNTIDDIRCSNKKIVSIICPACKEFGIKETLDKNGDILSCKNCIRQIEFLEKELNKLQENDKNIKRINSLKIKLEFLKVFSNHTLKGFKCNKCKKFVPNSYKGDECPYIKCKNILDRSNILEKKHPVTFNKRHFVYIQNPISKHNDGKEFSEKYCASGLNACDLLLNEEERINELSTILSVIKGQKKANSNNRKIPIKSCMYDAFEETVKEYPDEMSKYLIKGGQISDIAIQAIIFQNFVDVVEKRLPIILFIKGVQIKINDIMDERLRIFEGRRRFTNFMDHNCIIKRKSQIRIQDGKSIKDESDHFIGKIITINDSCGCDLKHLIDNYSFSAIKMKSDKTLKPATDVIVDYYSLHPSYTMGAMIQMQRIKKKLFDSINKKL